MKFIAAFSLAALAAVLPSVASAQVAAPYNDGNVVFQSGPTSFTLTTQAGVYQGSTTIGGNIYRAGETRDLTTLPSGHTYGTPRNFANTANDPNVRWSFYRQPNSIIIANLDQTAGNGYWFVKDIVGNKTPKAYWDGLPSSGSYTYTGRTLWHDLDLAGNREGDFSYTVNLVTKQGSGSITNLKGGSGIFAFTASGTLNSAPIVYNASDGTVGVKGGTGSFTTTNPLINAGYGLSSATPTYDLALFGATAQEVAGVIKINSQVGSIGIAGVR